MNSKEIQFLFYIPIFVAMKRLVRRFFLNNDLALSSALRALPWFICYECIYKHIFNNKKQRLQNNDSNVTFGLFSRNCYWPYLSIAQKKTLFYI